jgi:hypothetical protein
MKGLDVLNTLQTKQLVIIFFIFLFLRFFNEDLNYTLLYLNCFFYIKIQSSRLTPASDAKA